MKTLVIILLILGFFTLNITTQEGKKFSFALSLITNTIILILIIMGKIFF